MKVEALHVYPIKSLRGISLPTAKLTEHGFPYDRRFMLLRDHGDHGPTKCPRTGGRYENMHVSGFASMCLFTTSMTHSRDYESASSGFITVTYHDPDDKGSKQTLEVPLMPDSAGLEPLDINMHQSRTTAYAMPAEFSAWFSARFGFDVVFAYLGASRRPVLGNVAPNAAVRNARRRQQQEEQQSAANSWLSSLKSYVPSLSNGPAAADSEEDYGYEIGFADCAAYLVVSRSSLQDVSRHLPLGQEMDITKFRPNIIVSGADAPFDEDYWRELSFGKEDGAARIELTANCVRCPSINVDYSTGKPANGEEGQVLKKLQADRRVDTGHKYSPVFGRYGFLRKGDNSRLEEVVEINVDDEVDVTGRSEERTVFKWPGMGGRSKDDLYPI